MPPPPLPPLPLLLLLLLPLLLLPRAWADPGASPDPRYDAEWQPAGDGTEWLAALDPDPGNMSSSLPTRVEGLPCASSSACDLELLRRERIEVVKLKVLDELGLEAPPQGRARQVPEEFLEQVINEQQLVIRRNRRELVSAETKAIVTLAKQPPLAGHSPMQGSPLAAETIYFDLPPGLRAQDLGSARLLLRPDGQAGPLTYTHPVTFVNVYKVVPQGLSYQLEEFTTETVRPKTAHSEFASVNITELVYDWLRKPSTNHGLVIRVRDRHGAGSNTLFRSLTSAGSPLQEEKIPMLEVLIEKGTAKRRRWRGRRHAPPIRYCHPSGREKKCCLYELVVDFHQFSWDWIIAPVRYRANYCRGDCPAVYLQQYPHSHIAQQLGGSVGPCCGPRQLTSLWMLYWDNKSNIKWAELPGMKVRSCGCH